MTEAKGNRPRVALLAAVSVDMFIAPQDQELLPSTVWTSKEDKQFFTQKSKELKVMLMGAKTFLTIGRALPERVSVVLTSRPQEMRKDFLAQQHLEQLPENLRFTDQTPEEILRQLAAEGYQKVSLCGGATIYNLFLAKDLVDELYLTVEPVLFGRGLALFNYPEKLMKRLRLVQTRQLSEQGTLLLEYRREEEVS